MYEKPLKKCFVLCWKEVDMRAVKKGQLFKMSPASDCDIIDVNEISIAEDYASQLPRLNGYAVIKSSPVVFTRVEKVRLEHL